MTSIQLGSLSDDARRDALYRGAILYLPPSRHSLELCEFAASLIRDAFPGVDPELAQHDMAVERFAATLAELKPRFIHHPESKRIIQELLRDVGCDAVETHFDVPRMRSSTSDGYLTTGIAYAFHPHRDTWYSAPMCQINWWMPIFPIDETNGMAFHPQYWDRPVSNDSDGYNYQAWNATSRFNAAQQIGKDTRKQPHSLEPLDLSHDLRLVPPVGGILLFSAAHLHSSLPHSSGRTRFSIDFRTVHRRDATTYRGARNVDSASTGTAMPDFLRVSDLERLPGSVIDTYMAGHPQGIAR